MLGQIDNFTPLHWIAEKGDPTVISMLLNAGANPTMPNEVGWAPLHMAAWGNANSALPVAAEASGAPDLDPVGSAVDGAPETGRIDEGLRQQQRMAEAGRPVAHQSARA